MEKLREKGWQQMNLLLDKEQQRKTTLYRKALPYAAALLLLVTSAVVLQTSVKPKRLVVENGLNNSTPLELKETDFSNYWNAKLNQENQFSNQEGSVANMVPTIFHKAEEVLNEFYNEIPLEASNKLIAEVNSDLITEHNQYRTEQHRVLNTKKQTITQSLKASTQKPQRSVERTGSNSNTHTSRSQNAESTQQPEGLENKLFANQQENEIKYVGSLLPDVKEVANKSVYHVKTKGTLGLVSKNLDQYGVRVGVELKKPLAKNISVNTGVRISNYKEPYKEAYDLGGIENNSNQLVKNLSNRNVSRHFIELPVYADYEVSEQLSLKAGALLTYNKNTSENVNASKNAAAYRQIDMRSDVDDLLKDKHGYLGEAVIGASLNIDKITFDIEGNYGVISNQNIENRSIVGMRLSYNFGKN